MQDDDQLIVDDVRAAIKEKDETVPTFLFFDFETMQNEQLGENEYGPILKHAPNLCISHKVCDECRNQVLGQCTRCGQNRMVFEGPTCTEQFCEYLFSDRNKGVTAIAHNSKGKLKSCLLLCSMTLFLMVFFLYPFL